MKKLFALLVLSMIFVACDKDDDDSMDVPPKMILSFDPTVGGEEIQIGDRFTNPMGYSVELLEMKFYISNIKLLNASGSVDVADIAFIDLRQNRRMVEFEVEEGNYTGIQFDLGVPVEMNGTDNPDFSTSIYDADHPLSVNNGMYWGWNPGYRFFSLEGRYDVVESTEEVLPSSFAFHTGRDTLFRNLNVFNKSVSLSANDAKHLQFSVDLDTFFINENETVDLATENSFHGSPALLELGVRLANNSAASISLGN